MCVDVQRVANTRANTQTGAVAYVECSAKYNVGVDEVFDTAMKVALVVRKITDKKRKKNLCAVL